MLPPTPPPDPVGVYTPVEYTLMLATIVFFITLTVVIGVLGFWLVRHMRADYLCKMAEARRRL